LLTEQLFILELHRAPRLPRGRSRRDNRLEND
jgi:hypothetical protein